MSGLGKATLVIGLAAALAIFIVAAPMASASSPPSPPAVPSGAVSWAYSDTLVWNCPTLACLGYNTSETANYTITGSSHVYLGMDVIYIQQNTSTGTSLEVYVAEVGSAFLNYQVSETGSSAESGSANMTALGYAVEIGYANVTTGTTTLGNGTSVAALALQNAGSNEIANGTATYSASVSEGVGGSYAMNGYYSAQAQEQASIQFSPSLGLWPISPSVGQNWSDSSTYSGTGSYSAAAHEYIGIPSSLYGGTCPSGYTLSGSNCVLAQTNSTGTVTLASSGPITLFGQDLAEFNVVLANGTQIGGQVLNVSTTGNYGFTQGVVLLPNAVTDIDSAAGVRQSAASEPLTGVSKLAFPTSVNSDNAVYHPDVSGKDGISVMCTNVGNLPGKGSDSGYSSPVTVSAADSQVDNNLAMLQPSSSSSGGFSYIYIVVVVVVAVVVIVGVVVWSGRKRRRTPAAPASSGYPQQPQGAPAAQPGYAPYQAPAAPPPQYPPYQPTPPQQ